MTKITIIRHAESEANGNLETHVIAGGGIDIGLSIYGQKSINFFGDFYASELKDCIIVSSPMERCKSLMHRLGSISKIEPLVDERLQERDFKIHTGKTKREMLDGFQSCYPQDPAGDNFSEWMDREGLGFESNRLLKERIWDCIQDIQITYPDKDIVFITHTGIIRAMISIFTGILEKDINDVYDFKRIDNLSISQFEKTDLGRNTHHINHIPLELSQSFDCLRKSL